jgi:hypothetical protein
MKESCTEGLAIHSDPEPCVGDPQGRSEALDRGVRRPAIEPRNHFSGVPTRSQPSEGNTGGGVFASRQRAPRGQRTRLHACDLLMLRTGRSQL